MSFAIVLGTMSAADAQPAGPPSFASPEVAADRTITLRYFAPTATQGMANGDLDELAPLLFR